MSKCKTCGRNIHYGYGNEGYNSFEQKIGKINKDSWKKAIEQNCTIETDGEKTISYFVNNVPQQHNNDRTSLFCRLNCLNIFIALHYDYIANLPNIVNKD
jgi:hypothetical protein